MSSMYSRTLLLVFLPETHSSKSSKYVYHLGTLPCSFLDSYDCHHICFSWRRPRQGDVPRSQHFKFKVILCLTPVLFLFLPNTASDLSGNEEYRQLSFRLTFQVTIDLFDAVEMLDIVLDESQKGTETIPNPHGIPKEFGIVMVTLACFSFLLSLLQMAENKLDKGKVKQRRYLPIIRNLV